MAYHIPTHRQAQAAATPAAAAPVVAAAVAAGLDRISILGSFGFNHHHGLLNESWRMGKAQIMVIHSPFDKRTVVHAQIEISTHENLGWVKSWRAQH